MANARKAKSRKRARVSLPRGGHQLAAIGSKTEAVLVRLQEESDDPNLFPQITEDELAKLADALKQGWTDQEAAAVLEEYARKEKQDRHTSASDLCRWIRSHPNDSRAVLDCLSVNPPSDISIIRVLSRAGSQKLVFLATWRLTQRQVVLKRVTGPPELQRAIVQRESRFHPLSMSHENIIETHYLENSANEPFLVEAYLPFLLSDDWRSGGIHEAANLLCDMASALSFLQDQHLVHGDVKPDNIGKRRENYVLLDFGICREEDKFTGDVSATGSLRTRAPELFLTDRYELPTMVDIWALGATVFNAVVGRFPLFDFDEKPPRVSHPPERSSFEAELKRRVEHEWDSRVDLSSVPDPLKQVLLKALAKDPKHRLAGMDLRKDAEHHLSAYLRKNSAAGRFSPIQELDQFEEFLPKSDIIRLMPIAEKQRMINRLQHIQQTSGLDQAGNARVQGLLAKLAS